MRLLEPEREEHGEPRGVLQRGVVPLDHLRHAAQHLLVVPAGHDLLLQLGDLQQVPGAHQPGQLGHQGHVLGHRPRHLLELWIVLNKVLHVCDTLDLLVTFSLLLELLHQHFYRLSYFTEVGVDVGGVELVLRGGEQDLLQVPGDPRDPGQAHPVVVDSYELVHHGLVGPLGQQRRHGVLPPVQHQQHRALTPAPAEEAALPGHGALDAVGEQGGGAGALLVPDTRGQLEAEQEADQGLGGAGEARLHPPAAQRLQTVLDGQTVQVRAVGQVVNVDLLHLLHHLLHVRLRQLLDRGLGQDVGEVDVVGLVARPRQFGAQLRDGVRVRSEDADTLEVAEILPHALAGQPLEQVDLLPHEGGLREGEGDRGRGLAVQQHHLHARPRLLQQLQDVGLHHAHHVHPHNSKPSFSWFSIF